MTKRAIICISRQYGSGGRIIAEKLAEQLNIPLYDKSLLEKIAVDNGVSPETLAGADERAYNFHDMGFPRGLRNPYRIDLPDAHYYVINDQIFHLTAEAIRQVAAEGSCVIVGRVAEEVLKLDPDRLSVFIHASAAFRSQRIMAMDQVSAEDAARLMRKKDKERSNYHNYYSSHPWGDSASYDLALSTSTFGLDGSVELILESLKRKI